MNEISPAQLLSQIRSLNSEMQTGPVSATNAPAASGFQGYLKEAIDGVNETQQAAGALKRDFEAERSNVDLTEVMVAVQKADLSFRAMTEVRNKLVTAYQDIMNMPV
jgi:flagellar hook-basal body complex protein FliE